MLTTSSVLQCLFCSHLTVLQTNAANALEAAAASKNDFITLNSALRSSAQQYLLYKWKANGQCSQTNPVATPGTSNHEAGKAVDVSATTYWRTTLANYSYRYAILVLILTILDAALNTCAQNHSLHVAACSLILSVTRAHLYTVS
jgi:D-alanyl-D-alanine carboxypeptidase